MKGVIVDNFYVWWNMYEGVLVSDCKYHSMEDALADKNKYPDWASVHLLDEGEYPNLPIKEVD